MIDSLSILCSGTPVSCARELYREAGTLPVIASSQKRGGLKLHTLLTGEHRVIASPQKRGGLRYARKLVRGTEKAMDQVSIWMPRSGNASSYSILSKERWIKAARSSGMLPYCYSAPSKEGWIKVGNWCIGGVQGYSAPSKEGWIKVITVLAGQGHSYSTPSKEDDVKHLCAMARIQPAIATTLHARVWIKALCRADHPRKGYSIPSNEGWIKAACHDIALLCCYSIPFEAIPTEPSFRCMVKIAPHRYWVLCTSRSRYTTPLRCRHVSGEFNLLKEFALSSSTSVLIHQPHFGLSPFIENGPLFLLVQPLTFVPSAV